MDLRLHGATVPVEIRAQEWLRGRAEIDPRTQLLTLPLIPRRFERYVIPPWWPELALDLARVVSPRSALQFVERHGLLLHGPDEAALALAEADAACPRTGPALSEQVNGFLTAAGAMRNMLAIWASLRAGTDVEPLRPLIDIALADPELGHDLQARVGTNGLRGQLARFLAVTVSGGMYETTEYLALGEKGATPFVMGARSTTLRARAFRELAQLVVGYREIRHCEGCDNAFMPADPRQRFCDKACQKRTNQKRRRATRVENGGEG